MIAITNSKNGKRVFITSSIIYDVLLVN